jgi:hypothetical protein
LPNDRVYLFKYALLIVKKFNIVASVAPTIILKMI